MRTSILRFIQPVTIAAVFAAAARQYRYAFVTDFHQIPHFQGQVVVDVDDPTFSIEEAALLGRPNVAACVVTDERALLRYEALGVTKPIRVIPQPVSLDVFDADKAARIRAGREQQGIVFGHVAAWLRLRGDSRHGNALYDIDHLLDLWTDVRLRVPGSRLWLMGAPSPRVRRRCAQLDDVVLLGRLCPDDLLARLVNVDIALYARTAGGGMQRMKIAEYIAMGIPTVAYEHDETRILQTTRTGILVSSARQFVDAVTSLADDEAKRREMSAAGHALAPQFASEGIARRYEREVFDQYLS